MSKNPSVKILVGYHKPSILFKSDVLVPIHLGRALATEASKDGKMSQEDYQWMLDNMIGDDTGDNISEKNRHYNEMTGIYWAWKNYDKLGNPDYIGFCHYRRLFSFNEKEFVNDSITTFIEKNNIMDFHLLQEMLPNYDVFVPQMNNPEFTFVGKDKNAPIKDKIKDHRLKKVFDIIKEMYPQYQKYEELFLNQSDTFYSNMFIMKKEIFFEYCNFIFDVLKKSEQMLDYMQNHPRTLGYDSEFITAMFLYYCVLKYKTKHILLVMSCKELHDYSYIKSDDILKFCKPSKLLEKISDTNKKNHDNKIVIVLSANNEYWPYMMVCLSSLIKNASSQYTYEINILQTDISELNKNKLKAEQCNNIKINIFDMHKYIGSYKFYTHQYFTMETYYRLFIPIILPNADKALYIDSDTIITHDVADLYNINLDDNLIAATWNISTIVQAQTNQYIKDRPWKDYLVNELKMENPTDYFQAGVVLFNLKQMREENTTKSLVLRAISYNHPLVDQDVLNYVCKDRVLFFDQIWNLHNNFCLQSNNLHLLDLVPEKQKKSYELAKSTIPYIIHYAGFEKPWNNPSLEYADIWWKYAKDSKVYEIILYKNLIGKSKETVKIIQQNNDNLSLILSVIKAKHKIKYYRFMSKVTFGKMKTKYKEKYEKAKNILINL